VIPVAGLGTRLLPSTKEQPKEMLPVFVRNSEGQVHLKPILHLVFEKLFDAGFREFCFVVGRGKRSIEDYFAVDREFVSRLSSKNKISRVADELNEFYRKVNESTIFFTTQPEPKGFGDAVFRARFFTGTEVFLVHAGDDIILSKDNNHTQRLNRISERYDADVVLLLEKVQDPRKYGVISATKVDKNTYRVHKIEEKPRDPKSNMAATGVYLFNSIIYQAIENISPDENNEIQLSDAIQYLVDHKYKVYATILHKDERRIDIGTPESYWSALNYFFKTNLLFRK
jgi:UTP--glucose-1-phosphate uridylyltransferase